LEVKAIARGRRGPPGARSLAPDGV
jgi:hypothetical protein